MGLLQVDYDKLQVEVSRLRVEKEALKKQVASGDATIEELEKDKKTLIHDMAGTFEEGFQEALAQAVCMNPGSTFPTAIPLTTSLMEKSCPWSWMIEPPPSTITLFLYTLNLFLTLFDKLVIL